MSDKPIQDKRFAWLFGGIVFNTITSLTAITLWFFAPTRTSNSARELNPASSPGSTAYSDSRPLPPRPRDQAPLALPPSPGAARIAPQVPRTETRALDISPDIKVAPATSVLGERLGLRADLLTQSLGDEKGEIPSGFVKRLDKAHDAAKDFAKRHKLDEAQTSSVIAVFTNYEFNVLREEKQAGAKGPDGDRLEAFADEVVTSLRPTCGDEVSKAAGEEIARW